jgi:alkanesulfonate monooxygenase SsuD/methylene tetrahydromethanopterin reductase-like flavin-dependent oxidoreductase (luciferase family)
MNARSSLAIGFQVWGQHTTWDALMAAGRSIDEHGFEFLFSNDHLLPVPGPGDDPDAGPTGPILDGWMALAGWAGVTRRATLGCLVSGAGYRNPGLLVKLAATLDDATGGGRAVLGLGAGWFEREHRMFGFEYPAIGARLDRLEAQAAAIRGLLDGQEVTVAGRWVTMDRAFVQLGPGARVPLLVGGSGERRTLRIVARYADIWNADGGEPGAIARRNALLDGYCAEIGRDPATIRRTVGLGPPLVRGSAGAARQALATILLGQGMRSTAAATVAAGSPFAGTVDDVVRALVDYRAAGVEGVMFDWPAPFDPATLDALAGPVRDRLG